LNTSQHNSSLIPSPSSISNALRHHHTNHLIRSLFLQELFSCNSLNIFCLEIHPAPFKLTLRIINRLIGHHRISQHCKSFLRPFLCVALFILVYTPHLRLSSHLSHPFYNLTHILTPVVSLCQIKWDPWTENYASRTLPLQVTIILFPLLFTLFAHSLLLFSIHTYCYTYMFRTRALLVNLHCFSTCEPTEIAAH
jgi:hypothetical protein